MKSIHECEYILIVFEYECEYLSNKIHECECEYSNMCIRMHSNANTEYEYPMPGTLYGGGGGGCENVRPENNLSKNREREITFTEIKECEIRK